MSIRAAFRLPSTLTCKLHAQYIVHDPPPLLAMSSARQRSPFALRRLRAARSRCPSIQKCSELKPPEHLGTANIQPFRQFPPRPLLVLDCFGSVLCLPHSPCRNAAGSNERRPLVSPVMNVDIFCNTRRKSAFL